MKKYFLIVVLCFFSIVAFSQNKFTISGGIKDDAKGEEIISARIKVKDQPIGSNSNEYGFFSITLPEGKYTLIVSAYGFLTQEIEVNLNQNVQLSVQMKNPVQELD